MSEQEPFGDESVIDDDVVQDATIVDDTTVLDDGAIADIAVPEAEVIDFDQLRAQRDEYLDTLRRVQADFENARKRAARERSELLQRANEGLIEQLLPILDSFQLAMLNAESAGVAGDRKKAGSDNNLRKGVELVYAELLSVLERAGLERIEAEGKPFDPAEHEAVMSVEGDGDGGDPVVVEVMRAGWRLKGRVLRPAMVKVAK